MTSEVTSVNKGRQERNLENDIREDDIREGRKEDEPVTSEERGRQERTREDDI